MRKKNRKKRMPTVRRKRRPQKDWTVVDPKELELDEDDDDDEDNEDPEDLDDDEEDDDDETKFPQRSITSLTT